MKTAQKKDSLKFEIKLTLPHPPSINSYWVGARSGRRYLSDKARQFKQDVKDILIKNNLYELNLECNLVYHCKYYAPDKRKRDLDNFAFKGVFDALRDSKLFIDDDQFIYISAEKAGIEKFGKIEIVISQA